VAQANNLDFNIAMHTKGMEQIATLINRVNALEAETKKLASANAGLSASTDTVIRNGTRYNNALDAQSKQLRNARQGTQQLGMQINDFATSVSTGASISQAFSQQIGQVGYAMSMMGGTAGKIGNFLAGPWGALITIGAMALSPLINKLWETVAGAQAAEGALAALGKRREAEQKRRFELPNAEKELNGLIKERDRLQEAIQKNGRRDSQGRLMFVYKEQKALEEVNKQIFEARQNLDFGRSEKYGSISRLTEELNRPQTAANAATGGRARGGGTSTAKAISETDKLRQAQQAIIDQFKNGSLNAAEFETQLKAVTDSYKEAKNPAQEYLKEWDRQDQVAKKFRDTVQTLSQKTAPEWENRLNDLTAQYKELSATTRLTTADTESFNKSVTALLTGPIDEQIKKYDELIAKAYGVDESFDAMRAAIIASATERGVGVEEVMSKLAILDQKMAGLKIAERNADIKKSFEDIGNTVSDSFKGMITGATSWKDAMRGIINSVIDQLWKLYVVQQIVGFVTKAIGGLTGSPAAPTSTASGIALADSMFSNVKFGNNANGTVNWGGGMTWVGERGPELLNLPKGSQVIPAHRAQNMGGGGINISVDARGSADPAAVRAQVEQGILQAAPAIIAAAQQRTVTGLRRPKLGGVMQ